MANDFPKPHPEQPQGSALARKVLALLGWQLRFEGFPAKQGVMVVYPHTSNWDFVVLLLAKWAIGMDAKFWGKDSLFRVPVLGAWMRWLGGLPVNRQSTQGMVGSMVQEFAHSQNNDAPFWLALAPEGTRKWTPGWRSGFYRVATEAQVPLGICSVNFQKKTIDVTHFHRLSGDVAADMQRIAQALQDAAGKHPAQASPITLIENKHAN